ISHFQRWTSTAPSSTLFPYTTLFRSDRVHVPPDADTGPEEPPDRDAEDGEHPDGDGEGDVPADGRTLRLRHTKHRVGELRQLVRSEEHTSELQSPDHLVCRLLREQKK